MVNVRDAVARTVKTFAALAVSKGVAYSLAIDPAMPTLVLADDIRVQQVLGNLIGPCPIVRPSHGPGSSLPACVWRPPHARAGNAFKFTSHGGVHVSVGYAPNGLAHADQLLHQQPFEHNHGPTYPSPAAMTVFHATPGDPPREAPKLGFQTLRLAVAAAAASLGLTRRRIRPAPSQDERRYASVRAGGGGVRRTHARPD